MSCNAFGTSLVSRWQLLIRIAHLANLQILHSQNMRVNLMLAEHFGLEYFISALLFDFILIHTKVIIILLLIFWIIDQCLRLSELFLLHLLYVLFFIGVEVDGVVVAEVIGLWCLLGFQFFF